MRSGSVGRRRLRQLVVASALSAGVLLAGCAAPGAMPAPAAQGAPDVPAATSAASEGLPPPSAARLAQPARSQRIRFVPQRVVLPGGASAAVVPAQTVDGVLQVPKNVRTVGWWDGSAYVGDPFGATVIAGHVDSVDQGLGFFSRLLQVKKGARLTVTGDGHHASYVVTSAKLVAKDALTDDGQALDQTGDHRLVLITCGGEFRPSDGGYESNLVVVARPIGLAR